MATMQKSRPHLRRSIRVKTAVIVAAESLIAVAAVYGGIGLIAGNRIGMVDEWLTGTMFRSWVWPGILLLLVVASPMALAAVAEARRRPWAYGASLLAGLAQVGWILAQWLIIQRYFFLQPVMLAAGLVVLTLAWWAHRDDS